VEGVVGGREGALHLKVRARPEKGRANEAARRLVASTLAVPRSAVTLVRGGTSRDKLFEVDGLSEAELRERLP
jgi:uncharacterized protein YggU (UPF0235/DUF167 family)